MNKLLHIVIVLCIPWIVLTGAVRLNNLPWFAAWEYHRADFPADPYGMGTDERLRLAQRAIYFLNAPHNLELLSELRLEDGQLAFNARELAHMDDVKRAMDALTALGIAALVVTLASSAALTRRAGAQAAWGAVSDGGLVTLGALGLVAAFMLLAWERFFIAFHELLFPPDTWMFEYSDTLIRLFPERFWQDVGLVIASLVFVQALLLAFMGRLIQWRLTRPARDAAPTPECAGR